MRNWSVFTIAGAAVTLLAYQNCSNPKFQIAQKTDSSSLGEPPPVCREMTADEVKPQLLYSWNYVADKEPDYKQVMAAPVVGDLDGDKIPEIVFTSFKDHLYSSKGMLRVIDGATGMSKFSITEDDLLPFGSTTPVIVDIDRDGKGEIVYLHYLGKKVIALNYDGSVRWQQAIDTTGMAFAALSDCRMGLSAADLDGDGTAEIIAGAWIISENASKVPAVKVRIAENINACRTFAADLSETEGLRIVGGTSVMDKNGKTLWSYIRSGFPATADLLPEVPGAEVVVTGGGYLTIYNGMTGATLYDRKLSEHAELICRYDAANNPLVGGGQATIGDFDGDPSTLEIAVATGKSLTIFDNRGNKIAGSSTTDCSSLVTGITSFDFNGDGKPEIIYADEQYVRIYEMDGSRNLKAIWQTINPTGTLYEYPVVADVNGDGYAELVVVANNYTVNSLYKTDEEKAAAGVITGLRVYGPNKVGSWMPTRAVWNQHSYVTSNVNDDLTATSTTLVNGMLSKFFKRNTQKGLFQATCVPVSSPTGTSTGN
ncbi:FG-GAP repeat domain-containing protein [Bdellovibrio sp. HCB2-146]|uniref:FG-GAP repeat domain-containing protein n=1 Tax=Bdellovibrio sp. HCB2-146 TaxID=3394362 RepID=UPI0039BC5104